MRYVRHAAIFTLALTGLTGLAVIAALAAITMRVAQAEEVITLHFYERPPFMIKEGDGAIGLTADPAREAFEKAGVAYQWALTPAKRHLMLIEQSYGQDCAVGWLKNPERESYGKFSKAIYQDKPNVVLARRDFTINAKSLPELLADPKLRVIVKSGLTYGLYVIRQIEKAKADVHSTTIEQTVIARMIAANRADIMFATQEEAQMLVTSAEEEPFGLKVVSFPDIPHGNTRHIFCSRKVSDSIMAKLNAAIDRTAKVAAKRK